MSFFLGSLQNSCIPYIYKDLCIRSWPTVLEKKTSTTSNEYWWFVFKEERFHVLFLLTDTYKIDEWVLDTSTSPSRKKTWILPHNIHSSSWDNQTVYSDNLCNRDIRRKHTDQKKLNKRKHLFSEIYVIWYTFDFDKQASLGKPPIHNICVK